MKELYPETATEAAMDIPASYDTSDESRAATATADSSPKEIIDWEPAHTQPPAVAESSDAPSPSVSAQDTDTPDTAESEPTAAATSVSAPSDSSSAPAQEPVSPSIAAPTEATEHPPEAPAATPTSPGDAAHELAELREELIKLRTELQACSHPECFAEECEEFRTLYPDISLSALPDEVWESVRQGIPIAAAFALAQQRKLCTLRQAEESNRKNQLRSTGAVRRERPAYFTPEEVRAMTQEEVHENYRCILSSMQKWR